MKVSYKNLVSFVGRMKDDGIPMNEVSDALELDSDQEVDPAELDEIILKVYGDSI